MPLCLFALLPFVPNVQESDTRGDAMKAFSWAQNIYNIFNKAGFCISFNLCLSSGTFLK